MIAPIDCNSLFVSMNEGVAVHELVRDENGKVIDYRILAVNPAYERLMGISAKKAIGKTAKRLYGTAEPPYLDRYLVVAETRLSQSFETYFPPLDRYFLINAFSPAPDRFATVFMDISERVIAAERLRSALEERDILLKELYHRTKNNLQFVSGLIALESENIEDGHFRSILTELELKIQGMAVVHRRLYESKNLERIGLDEYIAELAPSILSCARGGDQLQLRLHCEHVEAGVDAAVAIGLIVNELLQNIAKHAFPSSCGGTVTICLAHKVDSIDRVELRVSDDGVGLPPDFDARRKKSTGLSLAEALVKERLRGSLSFESATGTICHAVFPETALR